MRDITFDIAIQLKNSYLPLNSNLSISPEASFKQQLLIRALNLKSEADFIEQTCPGIPIVKILVRLSRGFDPDSIEASCRIALGNTTQTRDAFARCTRDDETRWIYLAAVSQLWRNLRSQSRRFFSLSSSSSALFPFLLKCRHEKEKEAENSPLSLPAFAENMKIHTVARRKYPSFKMDGFRWI